MEGEKEGGKGEGREERERKGKGGGEEKKMVCGRCYFVTIQ